MDTSGGWEIVSMLVARNEHKGVGAYAGRGGVGYLGVCVHGDTYMCVCVCLSVLVCMQGVVDTCGCGYVGGGRKKTVVVLGKGDAHK